MRQAWEQVGDAYKAPANPALDRDGHVYFADPPANRIYTSDSAGHVTVFREQTNGARALRVGADGRLYASQPAVQRLVSYGLGGSDNDVKIVAQNIRADDIALTKEGPSTSSTPP